MEIIFLGTGTSQGVPLLGASSPVCLSKDKKDKRLRSSILIREKGKTLLVDCGPDFRDQMLRENSPNLDGLLITHAHFDHIAGLDSLFSFCFMLKKNLPIYLLEEDLEILKKIFFYFFEKERKGPLFIDFHKIKKNQDFFIEDIKIEPLEVSHGNLQIVGYKIGKFAYITDANALPSSTLEKLKNLDLLILNSLKKSPSHSSHFVLEESLEVIKKVTPKKAYLTHISYQMGFHEKVEKELPRNVFLAYDGLKVEI